jgi:hypothetical protein
VRNGISFGIRRRGFGQQTPRRWGLGNPAEETICRPNRNSLPACAPGTTLNPYGGYAVFFLAKRQLFY